MHVVEINGTIYRSLRLACKELHLNYLKARRLCRHYQRANKDNSIAVKWLLGIEPFKSNEAKTFYYRQDIEAGYIRQSKYKDRLALRKARALSKLDR